MLRTLLLWLQGQQDSGYATTHENLGLQFLELVFLPIVVTAILYGIKVMTAQSKPTRDEVIEVALEFAAVGAAASCSVFANDVIHRHWGDATQATGLTVFGLNIAAMVGLGICRRWWTLPLTPAQFKKALFLGFAPLSLDIILLAVGYFPFK